MSTQEMVAVTLSKEEALFPSEILGSPYDARALGSGDDGAERVPNDPLRPPEKVAGCFVPGCGEALMEAGTREGRAW
ncbi:MAG: hypothetical protein AVDCRST_MAG25-768 [uncultured Rubrobacteraceae bacterium]|uniref:Uncharacterized protein n=1 Tax=uncultured Rubrobacteraceae bacterium TaxID=349277 RepID=A0A6J4R8G4_9ACTN|nr:MAG: hypothetical protein AVDCRST_MAG25-768 [uncultured Rubrobacteraceae bacterium]